MKKQIAVYVGRFNPMHLGHQQIISAMLDAYDYDTCMVIIGSANQPQSIRHFFSYKDRRDFIKEVFPWLKIVGLPDYPNDDEWFAALNDIVEAVSTFNLDSVEFFAGCEEDVAFFRDRGYLCTIVNRFDGTTPVISGSQIRDTLLQGRSTEGLMDSLISNLVKERFDDEWSKFKKI